MVTVRTLTSIVLVVNVQTAAPHAGANPEQTAKAPGVGGFLGTWASDTKANEAAFQTGLFPREHGLKISTTSDALVVITTFRRASDEAGSTDGDKLSFKLDGSPSPGTRNGWSETTKLTTTDSGALVLEVLRRESTERLQTMTMSIERDRLRLVWSRGRFAETLFYVREK